LGELLRLTNRLARKLLGLLHDQLDGLDDTAQDLLDGDGDGDGVAERNRQRRRRQVGGAIRRKLPAREKDARRLDADSDDQSNEKSSHKDPAKRRLERTKDVLADIADNVHKPLFHTLLLSLP